MENDLTSYVAMENDLTSCVAMVNDLTSYVAMVNNLTSCVAMVNYLTSCVAMENDLISLDSCYSIYNGCMHQNELISIRLWHILLVYYARFDKCYV